MINLPSKHHPLLHPPYPHRQDTIQDEIHEHGPKSPIFSRIPAEFPVGVEGDAGYDHRGVAEREADVGEEVGLGEGEGGEVVGKGVVGGVFEVWEMGKRGLVGSGGGEGGRRYRRGSRLLSFATTLCANSLYVA